jgi:hypothetical protein
MPTGSRRSQFPLRVDPHTKLTKVTPTFLNP